MELITYSVGIDGALRRGQRGCWGSFSQTSVRLLRSYVKKTDPVVLWIYNSIASEGDRHIPGTYCPASLA